MINFLNVVFNLLFDVSYSINEFDILYGGSNYKVNDIVKFCSKLNPDDNIVDYISSINSYLKEFKSTLRIYQWSKNLLIFLNIKICLTVVIQYVQNILLMDKFFCYKYFLQY